MTIALGVFDLFAYAIPGFLYSTVGTYILARLGIFEPSELLKTPSIVTVIVSIVVSYLIGHATYPLGELANWPNRRMNRRRLDRARAKFAAEAGLGSPPVFLELNIHVLNSAIEVANREVAAEIARLRAIGIMLRNSAVPIFFGAVSAATEAFVGTEKLFATVAALVFAAVAVSCQRQGTVIRSWAVSKTYQLFYWVQLMNPEFRSGASSD